RGESSWEAERGPRLARGPFFWSAGNWERSKVAWTSPGRVDEPQNPSCVHRAAVPPHRRRSVRAWSRHPGPLENLVAVTSTVQIFIVRRRRVRRPRRRPADDHRGRVSLHVEVDIPRFGRHWMNSGGATPPGRGPSLSGASYGSGCAGSRFGTR